VGLGVFPKDVDVTTAASKMIDAKKLSDALLAKIKAKT
jgi:hypothetical protein